MSAAEFRKVFNKICENIKQDKDINDTTIPHDYLLILNNLFGDELISALQLIENNRIYILESEKQKQIFRVHGNESNYICFKNAFFCTCLSFKHKVATNGMIICKHILASRLAESLNIYDIEYISDAQMISLLTGITDKNEGRGELKQN